MGIKTKKISAGLYEYTDKYGREWVIEHIGPTLTGHHCDEWAYGYGNDTMADQSPTKRRAIENIAAYIEETDECGCGGALEYTGSSLAEFKCTKCGKEYQTPAERDAQLKEWFDNKLAHAEREKMETTTPTISRQELIEDMRINYGFSGDPVYWCYPPDPNFPIARGYSGANLDEIVHSMRGAGWVVNG